MRTGEGGLWSNCLYLWKVTQEENKAVLWTRIPQILLKAASPFLPIVFVRLILNEMTGGKEREKLFFYVFFLAVSVCAAEFLLHILDCAARHQIELAVRKVRNRLGNSVMKMEYQQVEHPKMRDFILLAQDGGDFMQMLEQLSQMLTALLTLLGLFSIMLTVQPVILLFIGATVLLRLLADQKSRKLWESWRPRYAPIMRKINYFTYLMKSPDFGKEIRINQLQKWIYHKTDHHAEEYLKAAAEHNGEIRKKYLPASLAELLQECVVYLTLAYRVVFHGMTIGDFSMYTTSVNTFSENVGILVAGISEVMQSGQLIGDFRYCMELVEKESGEEPWEGQREKLGREPLVLELKNVSFRYPDTDRDILQKISLTLREKESLSVVGVNGTGKTTLVKLICRLYEPTEGEICLNGIPIQRFPHKDYMALLGAVFQDFKLFPFSIRENVSMTENAEAEIVVECLKKAGLEKKADGLIGGLETKISKEFDTHGVEFSGGEGQRLAMARILYQNAPILLLDEPTSALDPAAEHEIYSRFREITRDKMTIYISHRLSSCQFCDKIAVLDGGRIVQYGTQEELLAAEGLYAKLWKMQAKYYGEEDSAEV